MRLPTSALAVTSRSRHGVFMALALAVAPPLMSPLSVSAQEDPFAAGVRPTEPVPADQQTGTLQAPPGFTVQLVTSEPSINKPMNMAFDARGRLWVTTSIEYPHPAPVGSHARDRLMVFSDFGPDGLARRTTQFADGLNIPIGIYPQEIREPDGRIITRAVVWSIPNIWILDDTDGDLVADRRTVLYGPFDHTRDTHGNQASFKRGFDGWLYATHGFNNHSRVAGQDGNRVDMHSGNTYRIRLDGSRIEHHTWGQVNPFGSAFDPWGHLYTSDCHSAPIYQLIPGGYYPSFGKPHDGLGFAPTMMEHAHGSTAIDGLTYIADDAWPETFHDNIIIGNVMTSRINRDQLQWAGSTPVAIESPDLLTTTDPWFRPVDTTLGPDGALYIADFYNRIIGHYEVPLNHPGRDRERGRIWRMFPGETPPRPAALPTDIQGLIQELGSGSLSRRILAMNTLVDRHGHEAGPAVEAAWAQNSQLPASATRTHARVHLLWLLSRLDRLTQSAWATGAADPQPIVRAHALRVAGQWASTSSSPTNPGTVSPAAESPIPLQRIRQHARSALFDNHPRVARIAAETTSLAPDRPTVDVLLRKLRTLPPADTHTRYAVRKALRDQFLDPAIAESALAASWSAADTAALADVLIAVPNASAARFLIRNLAVIEAQPGTTVRSDQVLQHVARHGQQAEVDQLAASVQSFVGDDLETELRLFTSVQQGLQQRGMSLTGNVRAWGVRLATSLMSGPEPGRDWTSLPIDGKPTASPWAYQDRPFANGTTESVLSSFPRGEPLMGILQSRTFPAPSTLRFWLAGHDGPPDQPAQGLNSVRLLDANTREVLREAKPPRNDVAQPVSWNLSDLDGRPVVLEIIDADPGAAYAWLAVGRLEAGDLKLPAVAPTVAEEMWMTAFNLALSLGLDAQAFDPEKTHAIRQVALHSRHPGLQAAATRLWARLASPAIVISEIKSRLNEPTGPESIREGLAGIFSATDPELGAQAVLEHLPFVHDKLQRTWALAVASQPKAAELLLASIEAGQASPRLLQDRRILEALKAAKPQDVDARVERLSRNLPDLDPARVALMDARRQAYQATAADPEIGRQLYAVNCQVCHQLGGQGGLVGPQLTGIGQRGVERLIEDILDPNRNVDHAFRTTVVTLADGQIITGLVRREEGALLVLANATGEEFSIPIADIEQREESELSLMPDNFADLIPTPEFNHLLRFLLVESK